MIRILLRTLVFASLFFFQATAYAAKTSRACTGKYMLHIKSASEAYGNPIAQPELYSFTAKGRCGKSVLNRCRERARSAALLCMEFHLNNDYLTQYSANKPPYYCSKYKKIFDYHINQLSTKIRQTACNATPINALRTQDVSQQEFRIKVKVISRVFGKKGCAADKTLKRPDQQYPEWIPVNCSR